MVRPALLSLALLGCTARSGGSAGEDDDGGGDPAGETGTGTDDSGGPALTGTDAQIASFYDTYGGRDAFPAEHAAAFEALLYAEDAVASGDLQSANDLIEGVFNTRPRGDAGWYLGPGDGTNGSNIGHPVAYYGLRMLEHVVALDGRPATGTLQMTAVVAPCATVTRPVYPGGTAETVELDVHPDILADDARRLRLATDLFRRWVQAITGGREVELVVHQLADCTTVGFSESGSNVFIYGDVHDMVAQVPAEVADATDLWWTIVPSGLPPTGGDTGLYFVTGGMGTTGAGLPLFLSDDLWFVEKPFHMGTGGWTEAELRAYHPQWFQHEFMHHLFRKWPEFGLEESGHQWFDRSTWPDDFEGLHEPDYYAEAITKRLLTASPSLADGLTNPVVADPTALPRDAYIGHYERQPVENDWHTVTVYGDGDGLRWVNAAGVYWGLELRDGGLYTTDDCPYGVSALGVEAVGEAVTTLWFLGEAYQRVE